MAACATQFDALLGCMETATVTCDSDGMADVAGCETEQNAYVDCSICLPSSQDDACDTCSKASCCDDRRDVALQPNINDYVDCLMGCSDASCADGCDSSYPDAAESFNAYLDCLDAQCSSECNG